MKPPISQLDELIPILESESPDLSRIPLLRITRLLRAVGEKRTAFRRARREHAPEYQRLSHYNNVLLKAAARKWAQRGLPALERKIAEVKSNDAQADPASPTLVTNGVYLLFLQEERQKLLSGKRPAT